MKPILFKDIMVRAILADTKTQTRSEKGLQILNENPNDWRYCATDSRNGEYIWQHKINISRLMLKCPYGQAGDNLWVRETWRAWHERQKNGSQTENYIYKATHWNKDTSRWKPSIHMPRKASRITLEIVDIRIERLMDISEQDAIAEGVEIVSNYYDNSIDFNDPDSYLARDYCDGDPNACTDTAIFSFHTLYQSINGIESYKKNPWVWVIVFRRDIF